jgi:glycosyltransferase involved in cell wall biosynthesis
MRLTDNVVFHGYLSQAELRKLQQQVDVCVMTSFAEGIPVVLMEAMAAGLPVVAPRITGIPELVEDGVSGYLTTPGRVDELADRIQRLLRDPELRQAFGQAGRGKVADQFCLETEVGKLAVLIEDQLSEITVMPGES